MSSFFKQERSMMDNKIPSDVDDKQNAEINGDSTEKIIVERSSPRISTETSITCRPYTSTGATPKTDGVMRNFSINGSYVETSCEFKPGTILILRVACYANMRSPMPGEQRPRSICLAEVKWRQKLTDENAFQYGMGLRYLD